MKRRNLLRTVAVIAASSLLAMTLQGAAFARGGGFAGGHGGGGFGGGHFGGGHFGGGFGGGRHAGFAGHGFGAGFAGRGFGGGFAGRGFARPGFGGGLHGRGGRGSYGRVGNGRYGYGRDGYGHDGRYGYGDWDGDWDDFGWGLGLGLYLSVLPWDYETLWWDGFPYYYADNAYYSWDPQVEEYQQVQPPPQVEQQAADQPPAQFELFAYPKNGQSDQQQATDKAQCREWARGQSGYNPADAATEAAPAGAAPAPHTDALTTAGTPAPATDGVGLGSYSTVGTAATAASAGSSDNVPPPNPQFARRADYLRAEAACLEGRGYSVR